MGLDQYAFARKGEENNELAYWRKHPNLQGWMENLYRARGGTEEVFNCVDVELDSDDLDQLEKDISEKSLPSTTGFFFGQSGDDYYGEEDREFIAKAREEIKAGYKIVYTSWW